MPSMSEIDLWMYGASAAAFVVARVAKFYPKTPPRALPWLALVVAVLVMTGMLMVSEDTSPALALSAALRAGVAGLMAGGAHQALRGGLERFLGKQVADVVLGRLSERLAQEPQK